MFVIYVWMVNTLAYGGGGAKGALAPPPKIG